MSTRRSQKAFENDQVTALNEFVITPVENT